MLIGTEAPLSTSVIARSAAFNRPPTSVSLMVAVSLIAPWTEAEPVSEVTLFIPSSSFCAQVCGSTATPPPPAVGALVPLPIDPLVPDCPSAGPEPGEPPAVWRVPALPAVSATPAVFVAQPASNSPAAATAETNKRERVDIDPPTIGGRAGRVASPVIRSAVQLRGSAEAAPWHPGGLPFVSQPVYTVSAAGGWIVSGSLNLMIVRVVSASRPREVMCSADSPSNLCSIESAAGYSYFPPPTLTPR